MKNEKYMNFNITVSQYQVHVKLMTSSRSWVQTSRS